MKSKIFSLFSFGILVLLVLTSFASATISFSSVPTLSKTVGSNTATLTFTTDETITSESITSITDDNGKIINFSIALSSTNTYTINYNVPEGFEFNEDKYSTVKLIGNTTTAGQTANIYFENQPIPSGSIYADAGDLEINVDDLSVENGFGDDTEWYILDEIKAKIYVENTGNDKIKSIIVQWGVYDLENKKWIVSGKESKFSLDDGDDKTLTVLFQLDKLNKIDVDNTEDYRFYAWATGENDNSDEKTSTYNYDEVNLQIPDDFVILDNIQITEPVSCGEQVHITADIINIGADDQDDVYVLLYNKDLGIINQKVSIGDIDSLEDAKLDATITIPEGASEKSYSLGLYVYNEDDDVYESDDNDESKKVFSFSVTGCSNIPSVSITAELESEAKAGQELTIRATIINTGSAKRSFNVDLSDYSEWASLVSVDQKIVELEAGSAKDVIIKLNLNKDVSGDKTFNILVTEGNKLFSQPVIIPVKEASGFPNITGFFTSLGGDNWYLWGIGALNVLLVLAIIIVAVKVARKK